MDHTLFKIPIKLHLLVCQVCCCAGARITLLHIATLFSVCRAPNRATMRAFFSRFVVHRAPMPACFFSRLVVHQLMLQCVLFFRGLSCTKSCSNACFFSRFSAPNRALMRVFFSWLGVLQCVLFSRFVVHQTVLQYMYFFAVCRAPNRAPMRAFFCSLSCTKSCSNACFFSRFVVHQIVLYGLNMSQLCGKSVLLLLFYSCSGNEKSAAKPKTDGFVLFSSSELRPGSGRS